MNDWNKLSETKHRQETAEIEKGPHLWVYGLGIAVVLVFYWICDHFLPFGRSWDNHDYGMAAAAIIVGPILLRTLSRYEKARALRDKRAIRIEMKLDQLLEVRETDSQDLVERISEVLDEVREAPAHKHERLPLPE